MNNGSPSGKYSMLQLLYMMLSMQSSLQVECRQLLLDLVPRKHLWVLLARCR